MTDADDIDDLSVEIARLVTEIAGLRAREQRYRLKAQGSGGNSIEKSIRGTAKYQLAMASQKREQAEARLRSLQLRRDRAENEAMMRNADDGFPAAMTPPNAGWTLRAFRSLNLGGRIVSRGQEITVEELSLMANAPALLAGGHIRWCPPAKAAAVTPTRPALVSPSPARASNPIAELVAAVKQDKTQLGIATKDALDLRRHLELKERAIRQYGELSRVVKIGAWGSGMASEQRSGLGTLRRVTDDFEDYICREVEKPGEAA
jgi:hypothetical protein